jgi:hypothetical protein
MVVDLCRSNHTSDRCMLFVHAGLHTTFLVRVRVGIRHIGQGLEFELTVGADEVLVSYGESQ